MSLAIRQQLSDQLTMFVMLSGTALMVGITGVVFGLSLNLGFAVVGLALVLTIWQYDRTGGLIAGIIFFFFKPFLVRVAFTFDTQADGSGPVDLLGVTPALLLAALIVSGLYCHFSNGNSLAKDKVGIWLLAFAAMSFLSIFNPENSVMLGLAGFERNILPNMLILLLTAILFTGKKQVEQFVKAMLIVGLLSCLYAIGQYLVGIYEWEKSWLYHVAFRDSTAGWLTIGLRGIEFRLFSIFYGYMDFFFVNVLIVALLLPWRKCFSPVWTRLRLTYFGAWLVILALTLERMPIIMTAVAGLVIYLFGSEAHLRWRVVRRLIAIAVIGWGALTLAEPALKGTQAGTLMRLAEMTNPLSAASIEDRAVRKWSVALATISRHPLGVGIGYGSETKANADATAGGHHVQPHNELLQKMLETGVIGGIIYLGLLIAVFRMSLKGGRSSQDYVRRLGIGLIGGTIAFWVCGLVNVPLSGSSGLLYWSTAGILSGVIYSNSRKESAITSDKTDSDAEKV